MRSRELERLGRAMDTQGQSLARMDAGAGFARHHRRGSNRYAPAHLPERTQLQRNQKSSCFADRQIVAIQAATGMDRRICARTDKVTQRPDSESRLLRGWAAD